MDYLCILSCQIFPDENSEFFLGDLGERYSYAASSLISCVANSVPMPASSCLK